MIKLYHFGIEIPFRQSMFPVGENYVRINDELGCSDVRDHCEIEWVFNGDSEIIQLLLLVNAIRNINKDCKIQLNIPYFPGGRQDRACEEGEGFGLKVYADLINAQNFCEVVVFDPHSDVTGALVNNIRIIDNVNLVEKSITDSYSTPITEITLISPDAGANKKIYKLANKLTWTTEVIRADKQRHTQTHEITGTVVYGDVKNKTCFIVDDICSRGGTFIALSNRLKEMGAAKVILIVSHYEGTADTNKLKESGIDKVYCRNDFGHIDPNKTDKFIEKIS